MGHRAYLFRLTDPEFPCCLYYLNLSRAALQCHVCGTGEVHVKQKISPPLLKDYQHKDIYLNYIQIFATCSIHVSI